MYYDKKYLAWLFAAILLFIFAGMLCIGCNTTKKIDKSVIKKDSISTKQSQIDSAEMSFDISTAENNTVTTVQETNSWEAHHVDSGQGLIISQNGTAEEYIEIPPANNKRTIFLPKNTKIENTKSNSKETKTEAKEITVKKKTDETVAVTDEKKEVHKDVKRWGLPWYGYWLLLLAAAGLVYNYRNKIISKIKDLV